MFVGTHSAECQLLALTSCSQPQKLCWGVSSHLPESLGIATTASILTFSLYLSLLSTVVTVKSRNNRSWDKHL